MGNRRERRKQEKKEITAMKALNRAYTTALDQGDLETIETIEKGRYLDHSRKDGFAHGQYRGTPLGRSWRPLWRLWPIRSRHGALKTQYIREFPFDENSTASVPAGLRVMSIDEKIIKRCARQPGFRIVRRREG